MSAESSLRALSRWIDESNSHRDPEAIAWGRISKIGEEFGEVIAAFIGWTAQNPRKGQTHSWHDVQEELLDVAVTALGAISHLHDNDGCDPISLLCDKIERVAARALGSAS